MKYSNVAIWNETMIVTMYRLLTDLCIHLYMSVLQAVSSINFVLIFIIFRWYEIIPTRMVYEVEG